MGNDATVVATSRVWEGLPRTRSGAVIGTVAGPRSIPAIDWLAPMDNAARLAASEELGRVGIDATVCTDCTGGICGVTRLPSRVAIAFNAACKSVFPPLGEVTARLDAISGDGCIGVGAGRLVDRAVATADPGGDGISPGGMGCVG